MRHVVNVIQSSEDHAEALARLEALVMADREDDTALTDALALLIEDYEKRMVPVPDASPIDVVRFRMEQHKLSQAELARLTKVNRHHISEFLNGHRGLSRGAMQAFHRQLDIPYDVFFTEGDETASATQTVTGARVADAG